MVADVPGSAPATTSHDPAAPTTGTRRGFPRRASGPPCVDRLDAALPEAHQVRLFTTSGQLAREVAWTRAWG